MRQARSLRCESCGGSAPIATLAPQQTCPFCGHVSVVPPALLAELRGYQASVDASLKDAHAEQAREAQWAPLADPTAPSPRRSMLLGFGLMLGLPLTISMVFGSLYMTGTIPARFAPYGSFAAMGAFALGAVLYVVLSRGRGERAVQRSAAVAGRLSACPHCGAANLLVAGHAGDACTHCHAPLLPSQTMVLDVLAEAAAEHRRARMARYRAERTGTARVRSYSASGNILTMIVGLYTVAIGFSAVQRTLLTVRGTEPVSAGLPAMWGAVLVGIALLVGIRALKRRRRQRWADALGAVARPFAGRRLETLEATVGWLNTYWAGPVESKWLIVGTTFDAVAATCDGFPTLLWVDPVPIANGYEPGIYVFVAAWIPGVSDGGGHRPVATAHDAVARLGFTVQLGEAGVLAIANPALVNQIRKRPATACSLAPAITALVALATASGARPVPPIA